MHIKAILNVGQKFKARVCSNPFMNFQYTLGIIGQHCTSCTNTEYTLLKYYTQHQNRADISQLCQQLMCQVLNSPLGQPLLVLTSIISVIKPQCTRDNYVMLSKKASNKGKPMMCDEISLVSTQHDKHTNKCDNT